MEGTHSWRGIVLYFLLISGFLVGNIAKADTVNGEWYSTARALTMGNAAITLGGDPATAMFYNPAALAGNRKASFEFFSPQISLGTGNFSLGGVTDLADQLSLEDLATLLNTNPLTSMHFGFSLYPNFSAKNFGAGVLLSFEASAAVDNESNLFQTTKALLIPTIGISVGLFSGLFKIGAAARLIQSTRKNIETSLLTADFSELSFTEGAEEGLGFGLDAGFIWTLPWSWLPTFGGVIRNIGGTDLTGNALFSVAGDEKVPHSKIDMTIDGGVSVEPKLGQRTILRIAADYRDVTNTSNTGLLRKVNLGLELGMKRRVFFRAGYSQGYWTAGFGLSGKSASLDLGTYGEEIHPTETGEIEDRRIVIRYGSKF